MNRLYKGNFLFLLLVFALLCGCGTPGNKTADNGDRQPSASNSETPSEPEAVYDLMQEKWAPEKTDVEITPWSVANCLEIAMPNPADADFSSFYSAVEGSCHYLLTDQVWVEIDPVTQQALQTAHSFSLTTTDVNSNESVMEIFELQPAPAASPEETAAAFLQAFQDNLAVITGMDVSGGSIYLFFQQSTPEHSETTHYYRVRTNTEGLIEEVTDLFPALQSAGIIPEDNILLPGGKCDGAGRCYLGDAFMNRICIIDQDGSLLTVLEDPTGLGKPLACIGKLPEGTPLYACADFQGQSLSVLSFDGQEGRELYRGEYEYLEQCLLRPNGDLLYGSGGKLLCWNVVRGTRERLYEGRELNFANCEGIVWGADEKPYAVFQQGDGTFLYGFTDEKTETVTIHIEQIAFVGNEYLQKCASAYTSRHPGVVIEVSEPETDRDLQLSRLITRLSPG